MQSVHTVRKLSKKVPTVRKFWMIYKKKQRPIATKEIETDKDFVF